MKFCGKCGNQLALTQKFCNKCGTPNPNLTGAVETPKDDSATAANIEMEALAREAERLEADKARQQVEREKQQQALAEQRRKNEEEQRRQREESERYELELQKAQQARLAQIAADKAKQVKVDKARQDAQHLESEKQELQNVQKAKEKLIRELEELEALKRKRNKLQTAEVSQKSEEVVAEEDDEPRLSRRWGGIVLILAALCAIGGTGYYYYMSKEAVGGAKVEKVPLQAAATVDTVVSAARVDAQVPAAKLVVPPPVLKSPKAEEKSNHVTPAPSVKPVMSNNEPGDAQIKNDLIGKRLSSDWTFHSLGEIVSLSKSAPQVADGQVKYELYMTLRADNGQLYTCRAGVTYMRTGNSWQMMGAPVQHFLDEKN